MRALRAEYDKIRQYAEGVVNQNVELRQERDVLRVQLEGRKKVAQEAEKVRDLALEAKAAAELARVKAEQDRDGLREQLEAEVRAKESLGQILKAARSEAIKIQREHTAMMHMFADASAARVKAEQELAEARELLSDESRYTEISMKANQLLELRLSQARQEADTLRRQVEAMSAPIAAACSRFGHLDMVLKMAHDPDGTENTNPWHACARDLWRAVKAAKEAK